MHLGFRYSLYTISSSCNRGTPLESSICVCMAEVFIERSWDRSIIPLCPYLPTFRDKSMQTTSPSLLNLKFGSAGSLASLTTACSTCRPKLHPHDEKVTETPFVLNVNLCCLLGRDRRLPFHLSTGAIAVLNSIVGIEGTISFGYNSAKTTGGKHNHKVFYGGRLNVKPIRVRS